MYIPRTLTPTVKTALDQFPAVLVTGPRQSGKTTFLLQEFGSRFHYVSLDDPLERQFAHADPNGFLDRFQDRPVILDEIQYVPEIFPYLKLRIDRQRQRTGWWLLTGSQQFQLMRNVTESLAGRIALLELPPFSLLELGLRGVPSLGALLWTGGYPEPALHPEKQELWVRSYIQTYVERDVRQLQNIRDLRTFEAFLALCAAHHGQIFNAAALSRKCGITLPTVQSWASVLEASYVCRFISPHFRNFGKRLIKAPKLYFLDSALVNALTRQPNGEAALAGPMGGATFEGLIVSETYKAFVAAGQSPEIYFWRSRDGLEVDLIVQIGQQLYPVEVKLTATPTLKHIDPLNKFRALAGKEAAPMGVLVCQVPRPMPLPSDNVALPWQEFPEWLRKTIEG
jgi:uncharacterized protein